MTSVGPTSSSRSSSLTPWRQRQPRKLNFLSCSFCRKAKVKCVPLSQAPAAKKCTRCSQKDLVCSALTRKTTFRDDIIQGGYVDVAPVPIVPSSDINVHDALVLLSLQHILGQAVDELLRIGQQQLMPLKGDRSWAVHGELLDHIVSGYTSLLAHIREKLLDYTGEVAQTILRASIDITYTPQFFEEARSLEILEKTLSPYKAQKHHGVATILQISKLRYSAFQSDANVQAMILDRNTFIDSLSGVTQRHNLGLEDGEDDILLGLANTQLFMPAALFQIPGITQAIKHDGRSDCLGRPVGHMFHDNKVDELFRYTAYEDGKDVLGRSRVHIACSLTSDQQIVSDLKNVSISMWSNISHGMFDLRPLDIAAIHGNVEIFTIAPDSNIEDYDQSTLDEHVSRLTERTCLHWAACFGHLAVVEHILELCKTDTDLLNEILTSADANGDTPLHIAARNGHLDVVKSISRVTNWELIRIKLWDHTPFWAATSGRNIDVMKFLQPFCDNDGREYGVRKPLAEAAKHGFRDGVDYPLQLDCVSINSISDHWNSAAGKLCGRTPLDLAIKGGHNDCFDLLRQHGASTYFELEWRKDLEV